MQELNGELAQVDRGLPFAGSKAKALDFTVRTSPGFAVGGTVTLRAGRELAEKMLTRYWTQVEPVYVRLRETAVAGSYASTQALLEDVREQEFGRANEAPSPAVGAAVSAIYRTFGEVTEEVLDEIIKDLDEAE